MVAVVEPISASLEGVVVVFTDGNGILRLARRTPFPIALGLDRSPVACRWWRWSIVRTRCE